MLRVTALGLSKVVGSRQAEANNCLKVLVLAGQIELYAKTAKVPKHRVSNIYVIKESLAKELFSESNLSKLEKLQGEFVTQNEADLFVKLSEQIEEKTEA